MSQKPRPRILSKVKFNVTVHRVPETAVSRLERAIRNAIEAESSMPQTPEEQISILTDIFGLGPEENFNR
jgi:hypothetical protein